MQLRAMQRSTGSRCRRDELAVASSWRRTPDDATTPAEETTPPVPDSLAEQVLVTLRADIQAVRVLEGLKAPNIQAFDPCTLLLLPLRVSYFVPILNS